MTIKERIQADFMEAYKAKDMKKKDFLGVVRGAIQTQEGKKIESTDENVLKVLKSIEKGIVENIEGRKSQGLDISEQELELNYVRIYQPALMSEDEIRVLVKDIIQRQSMTELNNGNVGKCMGFFVKENRGKEKGFDNKIVDKIVKEELSCI